MAATVTPAHRSAPPGTPCRPTTGLRDIHLRTLFADDPGRGERMTAEAAGLSSTTPSTGSPTRRCGCCVQLAEESRAAGARIDAMFRGEQINVTEDRAVLHVALRMPRERVDRRRRPRRRARGPRGARPDGRLRRPRPRRRLDGPHRQADPQRGQHRHRRLRPRAGDGLRGAAPLQRRATLTFRFVSNVDGTDFAEATRDLDPAETLFIVSSKTFTTLETMTNARTARDVVLRRAAATRRRSPSTSSPSRPTPRRCRSSASTPTTCSASGTGSAAATRWTRRSASRRCSRSGPSASREMLAGFHAMDEHFRTDAVRAQPAGADGAAGRLVRRLLRRRDGRRAALRPVPQALPGLPAAADDGVQRQARDARRRSGRLRDRAPSTGASRGPTASTPSTS